MAKTESVNLAKIRGSLAEVESYLLSRLVDKMQESCMDEGCGKGEMDDEEDDEEDDMEEED